MIFDENAIIPAMGAKQDRNHFSFKQLLVKSLAVFFLGTILFFILSISLIGIYQIWYADQIFPGIAINDVGVGGMTLEQAAGHLISHFEFTDSGKITLWHGEYPIEVTPDQIGISLDWQSSITDAYNYGRKGSIGSWFAYQLSGNFSNHSLPPSIVFDQSKAYTALKQISDYYDQPMKEASLYLNGMQVITEPGQIGKELDIHESIKLLNTQITELNLEQVILPVKQTNPQILDVGPFASAAQTILSRPLALTINSNSQDDYRAWNIEPEELAPMLTFEKASQAGQTTLIPQLKTDHIDAFLVDLGQQIEISTENPRFIFNDDTQQLDLLTPGIEGLHIDHSATIFAVNEALQTGRSSVEIALVREKPQISDSAIGADLSISELVHSESSYFFGSSEARVQNIETAASQFHGLLIPPYTTFSMAESMDEITLDNGYAEALIIYNGQTIEGVGGGVCQVSTTLFRAAFFAGFPITERHPHAYRVSYYEKTSGNSRNNDLAGLDATVYVPLIDLKFENDTPYWLLMETYINRSANRITWKFYSTWDGRSIQWQTSGPTNIEKPKKPLYNENRELDKGEIEQVEWEAEGADVRVDRTVYLDNNILFKDTFTTHYEPWRAIYEYGPGTSGIPENDGDD